MKLRIYQVDAFTDVLFSGNPAAVIPLEKWLDEPILQKIALENNLSETAYFVKNGDLFHIRWFTPKAEVDLCGHATLATAFVLFELHGHKKEMIRFQSKSGILTVAKKGPWLTLNFPADQIEKIKITDDLLQCFDKKPVEIYRGRDDFMYVYSSQKDIESINPDFTKIARIERRGIIITAKGKDVDFVSRYFAPAFGVNEDPATGSAHTTLTPYWSKQLDKKELTALQLSKRGGYFRCKLLDVRVEISGKAVLYMTGEILI